MDTLPPPAHHADAPSEAQRWRGRILDKLTYSVGKDAATASDRDWFVATALALRDAVVDGWLRSDRRWRRPAASGCTTSRSSS